MGVPTPTPGFETGVPPGGTTSQVLKKNSGADGDTGWGTPVSGLTVPQSHEGATGAPAAAVSDSVVTTASTSTTPFGYSQAQADDIVAELNAATADIATLVTELGTLTTAHNALLTALHTAGILS
jgi:hypothetical protein